MMNFTDIENLFKNKDLLKAALTHRSWINEHPNVRENNERLEFLGDAVLELVVSRELYIAFKNKEEGYLTSLRANLVNTVNLHKVALKLEIGEKLFLSKGEEDTGGRTNQSLLADCIEAIIGALFIDGGLASAEIFIKENLLSNLEEQLNKPLKDAKSLLQEYVQAKGLSAPKYEVVEESGPDHDKIFRMQVLIDGKPFSSGCGRNKSEAAQDAAKKALENFL